MGKKRNGSILTCKACQNEYYVPYYRKDVSKFCSLLCQNKLQYTRFYFTCKGCGKKSEAPPSRSRANKIYCSLECRALTSKNAKERRKESTLLTIKKRGFNSSRLTRKYIFEFKMKKCEICGYDEYDFNLDIHHIDHNPLNNIIENMMILCVFCHRKHHKGVFDAITEREKQKSH